MDVKPAFRERLHTWAEVDSQALVWAGARAGLPPPEAWLARHRTGWTAKVEPPGLGTCVLKVYHYPGLESLRGFLRTTFLARSRPAREGAILAWLAGKRLGPELALAAGERRRWGWLTRTWLLTRYWEAPALTEWLQETADPALAHALGTWLARAHALGLEDKNPHLRNFLARPEKCVWTVVKIDSPKARLHRGAVGPSGRARDLALLCTDATRLGVGDRLARAFQAGYGRARLTPHSTS